MVYHAHCAVTPWSKTQHIYLSKFKYLFNIFGSAFSLSIVIELKRSMKSNCHGDPLIPPVPPSPPTLPLRPHLGVGQQGVQPHLVPHPTWTLRRRRTTATFSQVVYRAEVTKDPKPGSRHTKPGRELPEHIFLLKIFVKNLLKEGIPIPYTFYHSSQNKQNK